MNGNGIDWGPLPVVAIDDGYAQVKAVARVDGEERAVSFAARARSGAGVTGLGADAGAGGGVYVVDGEPYTVHEHIDGEDTRFEGYPTSGLNHALVHHALVALGLGGREARVVSGLPLGRYYLGGTRNERLIETKRSALLAARVGLRGGEAARIAEHRVYPQGVAVWMDAAILPSGRLREEMLDETVAVVDVGGRTTDVAVILPGRHIDHERCGTLDQGALHIIDEVGAMLCRRFALGHVSQRVAERALRERRFSLGGRPHGVEDEVREAAARVGGRIVRMVENRLGSGAEVDRVIFAGGGAAAIAETLSTWAEAVAAPDPAFANARGMYKYAVHVDGWAG